jgi:ribulose 1,5-bisphosphate synthetase/thiazole synthase
MAESKHDDYDSTFGFGIQRMLNGMFGVKSAPGKKKERTREMSQREVAPNLHMATEDIPVLMECEVLVVGGGPGGLSAAVGAARAGADVVLMERFGCFGGVITTVGMETLAWYRYEGTKDGEGIGKEMERVAHRMGATEKFHYNDSECLNAEAFKLIADEMVRSNGIRPLLHCFATDVILEPAAPASAGRPKGLPIIKGVIIESKAGRQCIRAKRVIDCTGDADIAHRAGTPFTQIKREELKKNLDDFFW